MSTGPTLAAALALWAAVIAVLWRLMVMSRRAGAEAGKAAAALETARRLAAAAKAAGAASADPASPEEILRRGDETWKPERRP